MAWDIFPIIDLTGKNLPPGVTSPELDANLIERRSFSPIVRQFSGIDPAAVSGQRRYPRPLKFVSKLQEIGRRLRRDASRAIGYNRTRLVIAAIAPPQTLGMESRERNLSQHPREQGALRTLAIGAGKKETIV
jgi:hypothetical protein